MAWEQEYAKPFRNSKIGAFKINTHLAEGALTWTLKFLTLALCVRQSLELTLCTLCVCANVHGLGPNKRADNCSIAGQTVPPLISTPPGKTWKAGLRASARCDTQSQVRTPSISLRRTVSLFAIAQCILARKILGRGGARSFATCFVLVTLAVNWCYYSPFWLYTGALFTTALFTNGVCTQSNTMPGEGYVGVIIGPNANTGSDKFFLNKGAWKNAGHNPLILNPTLRSGDSGLKLLVDGKPLSTVHSPLFFLLFPFYTCFFVCLDVVPFLMTNVSRVFLVSNVNTCSHPSIQHVVFHTNLQRAFLILIFSACLYVHAWITTHKNYNNNFGFYAVGGGGLKLELVDARGTKIWSKASKISIHNRAFFQSGIQNHDVRCVSCSSAQVLDPHFSNLD